MKFPDNKRFAFSILDDTDDSTLDNVKPVYDALGSLGFRTTKTVWALNCPEGSRHFFAAETLQSKPYRDFIHTLVDQGFELAFHGATMESSDRERTQLGLEFFKQEFGSYPKLFCNHGHNRENLYWGSKRFQSLFLRQLFRFCRLDARANYDGDEEGSPFFWGDLCKQHIKYVRNFTFYRLNMLDVNPDMPYRLSKTPYVNYWFSTADAPDVRAFNWLLSPNRIDQLVTDGGVCIVSTHFGKGFVRDGTLDPETAKILHYLSTRPGWFVPVSEILDYLLGHRDRAPELGFVQRLLLECRFVADKVANARKFPG
ncbi:MAG: hypothetical protein E6K69_05940 [Nitrospirae bacterium]|nr:MAG: hypothetical protein E6K69_05940 [Nitrospirota bacterium]